MISKTLMKTRCKLILLFSTLMLMTWLLPCAPIGNAAESPQSFYVDPGKGNDANPGSIDNPFASIQRALLVVGERVEKGVRSDKIYLRGGVYRNTSMETVYRLNLKGTPVDYAMLSAMPCKPNTPGGVKRKSGQWYEKVIIDDGRILKTSWTRLPDRPVLWMTKPGFTKVNWGKSINHGGDQLWNWRGYVPSIGKANDSSNNPIFVLAPYMMLQDGKPLLWEDTAAAITAPGTRSYDQVSGILYLWPFDNKDPNTSLIESWYGGPDREEKALLDGEGHAVMDGQLTYAAIRGIEFRLFVRIMENHLRYGREEERIIQRHVLVEDNQFTDGWVHFMLDTHGHALQGFIRGLAPKYTDRSHWTIRNNVFLRPSREVWQIHGDGHVFEYNDVIDHLGPWTGPAAISCVTNSRNSTNAVFRYNRILGHNDNRWWPNSVFTMEIRSDHGDANGDYLYGGELFEYNLVANVSRGNIFGMGRSTCRMKNVTIRHNVFISSREDVTVEITSPHLNLSIEHNVFVDQQRVIDVTAARGGAIPFESKPSSISIQDNIFIRCKEAIDPDLLVPVQGSSIFINRNLFWNNAAPPIGTNVLTGDPRFRNPLKFDFRVMPGSPAIIEGRDLGIYDADTSVPSGTDWWQMP